MTGYRKCQQKYWDFATGYKIVETIWLFSSSPPRVNHRFSSQVVVSVVSTRAICAFYWFPSRFRVTRGWSTHDSKTTTVAPVVKSHHCNKTIKTYLKDNTPLGAQFDLYSSRQTPWSPSENETWFDGCIWRTLYPVPRGSLSFKYNCTITCKFDRFRDVKSR